MTVLAKKVFTSSKPVIVRLLCPPPRGPFSIQESAVGGLSYKVKKDVTITDHILFFFLLCSVQNDRTDQMLVNVLPTDIV